MAAVKYISRDKLPQWLAALAADRRVLVPVAEGDGVVFRPYDPAREPVFGSDATAPPKSAIFPACQELFRYEQTKNADNIDQSTMTLDPEPGDPGHGWSSGPNPAARAAS